MKRILSGALAAALMTSGIAAHAYEVPNTNSQMNLIQHETYNCDAQAQAKMLNQLGLFLGTDKGFELDRSMTRAEAAAMLCRFLGGEAEAKKSAYAVPFTDVPAWAKDAVGWLYHNQLAYGVSGKQYGSSQPVTAQQFAAFLSRALTSDDSMADQLLTENEASNLDGQPFLRSYAVAMAVRALPMTCYRDGNYPSLAKKLAGQGVFTAEQFTDAAWDVLPPTLDGDTCMIAELPRMKCSEEGLREVDESVNSPQPFYYATRQSGDTLEFWRVDWKTMQAEKIGEQPALSSNSRCVLLGTVAGTGKDYLLEKDSEIKTGRLFSIAGNTVTLELDKDAIGESYLEDSPTSDNSFAFEVGNGVCTIDQTGVHIREIAAQGDVSESKILFTGTNAYVTQTVTDAETILFSRLNETDETVSSYTIPHDSFNGKPEPRTVEERGSDFSYRLFYGEGGFYRFDQETGEMMQMLDCAVQDITSNRGGDPVFYLTHGLDKRIGGGINALGGDTIVVMRNDERKPVTLVDASAGIEISGFTDYDVSSSHCCEFFSSVGVGMQHFNQFTYYYDDQTGKITVRDYQSGYPEMENSWSVENPDAYKKEYIEREQARLDAVWNSKR
ncbi:hypothetical protein D7X33_09300 [Butyricicoccus sp. 1XD8-22]|nr:hypothetical protein D7X33_09300 [Butyricicoccus sp. 1XD8-22]